MLRQHWLPGVVWLALSLLLLGNAMGEDACPWDPPDRPIIPLQQPLLTSGDNAVYTGTIRVYVTEPTGRWLDDDNEIFRNAFLAFALQEPFSLGENDTLHWETEWNGNDYYITETTNLGDIEEGNVEVVAAVFNSAGYTGYSDPPTGMPFTVHEVDACAAATCATDGYNIAISGFTHSVLVEDGASTW